MLVISKIFFLLIVLLHYLRKCIERSLIHITDQIDISELSCSIGDVFRGQNRKTNRNKTKMMRETTFGIPTKYNFLPYGIFWKAFVLISLSVPTIS